MRRPWFPFYSGEWLSNTNLKRCSHEEKGVWIDLMCLLHDSTDGYGMLRWPLKEIAQALGCRLPALKGLVTKGVLKGADVGGVCAAFVYAPSSGRKKGPEVVLVEQQAGPLWFSSRMLTDEYKRKVRAGADESDGFDEGNGAPKGKPKGDTKGGKKTPPNPPKDDAPKPPFGDGFGVGFEPHPSRGGVSEPEPEPEKSNSVPQSEFSEDPTGDFGSGGLASEFGYEPDALRYEPSETVLAELFRAGIPIALATPEVLGEFRIYWAGAMPRASPAELDAKFYQRLQKIKNQGSSDHENPANNRKNGAREPLSERVRQANREPADQCGRAEYYGFSA